MYVYNSPCKNFMKEFITIKFKSTTLSWNHFVEPFTSSFSDFLTDEIVNISAYVLKYTWQYLLKMFSCQCLNVFSNFILHFIFIVCVKWTGKSCGGFVCQLNCVVLQGSLSTFLFVDQLVANSFCSNRGIYRASAFTGVCLFCGDRGLWTLYTLVWPV